MSVTTLSPDRGGCGNRNEMRRISSSGASIATSLSRSICFSFDLALDASEAFAPNRSTNRSMRIGRNSALSAAWRFASVTSRSRNTKGITQIVRIIMSLKSSL